MIPLTDAQMADYFHRSYTAVDGLWFMKLEERAGFDTALDVDVAVWSVMGKIQARKLKELTGAGDGLDGLVECLTTKFTVEGFTFTAARSADGRVFEIHIRTCPWVELLRKSNRLHLAETIGSRICDVEHAAWTREFGENIRFEFAERLCGGEGTCRLRFLRDSCPSA